MTDYTVSSLVAEFLAKCEVETVFGIVSVHNIPMLDAIAQGNSVRFAMTRGEAGAAHMADGYARASGGLGVLFTSTGPGAANAVAGLVEARFASTPLLHITGQTLTRFADRGMNTVHDVPDQLGIMAAAGKASYRIRAAEDALGVLKSAVAAALTHPRGPVTVEIPIDIQRTALKRPASLDLYTLPKQPPQPPTAPELDELVRLVSTARRPMLWLGRGAADAGRVAQKLLDLGFGMVTSWAGRGAVSEDHPRNLGALNGAGLTAVESFYESVDLMLVVGSSLRGHETVDFSAALPKNIVRIDLDPRADGKPYGNIAFVQGDACSVLDALLARLDGKLQIDASFPDEVAQLKRDSRAAFARALGPYATFAEQLRTVLPRDTIWARDVTINNSTWGHKLFPLHDPSTNIYPIGAGIGQGMCLGIGAALAPGGRKTAVLIGDGGFALSLCELWTAIQEQLDIVIIVANDQGYGVIRHIQDKAAGGRRRFDTLAAPDLGELARVAGVPFWRVDRADAFGSTVAEAVAVTGPTIVEIDMTAIGHHPPYFPYAPKVGADA